MKTASLSKQYALISLNGERVNDKSVVGKMKNRCIVAAILLEYIQEGKMQCEDGKYVWKESGEPYKETESSMCDVLHLRENKKTFSEWTNAISKISNKNCRKIAGNLKKEMKEEGLLEEISALIECDFFFETAGTEAQQYRTTEDFYRTTIEYIKAEALDGGEISEEVLCLLWMLKQSDDLMLVFTSTELDEMKEKYIQLYRENPFAHQLFEACVEKEAPVWWKRFLSAKRNMAKTQVGAGVVSRFPILERSEAVFIATESWFPDSEERLNCVLDKLLEKGHICEVKSMGDVPVMAIDYILYELIPDAVSVRVMKVHGVRLRRYLI